MEQERRDLYRRYIRTTMSQGPRHLRHLTVTRQSISRDIDDVWVTVDSTTPGIIELSVHTASVLDAGMRELKARGLRAGVDEDDQRFTVYSRTVASASVDDIVTFIDWAMIVVSGAPHDYEPSVSTGAMEKQKGAPKGCFNSCTSVIKMMIFILAAFAALIWYFS